MKKILIPLLLLLFLSLLPMARPASATISEPLNLLVDPQPCLIGAGACPAELRDIYVGRGEACVSSYDEFKKDPMKNHFWINDPDITYQGKADERARQFIYWVLNNNAIDEHPVLKTIWGSARNVAYFFVLLVAAVLGLGFIIGQRANFDTRIKIWPSVMKVVMIILYISFSAALVLTLIQVSEIIMKFFMETLGGNKLFNIYFSGPSSNEQSYITWVGCRDLNFRVQEGVRAEVFMLNLTNITYYVMGVMVLLRKILLWFLLFVAPFLAVLMPFVFIRNIGWIWIGVFFQWLFYGPLFALFLGATATIWRAGIPFRFDFSRANNATGYVYPLGINLTYGGPAQTLTPLNSANYVDTFAEYVISLIMLWAVIFFPWWLLRIFRDYCCDGIYAMKNILLSLYDKLGNGPAPQPPMPAAGTPTNRSTSVSRTDQATSSIMNRMESIEEIKKVKTEDISKSLNLTATKLTDIARFETNKSEFQSVKKNIDYLANPTKAETPSERQKFMNIRTELFSRAVKEDHVAKQILSATSTSRTEQLQRREEIIRSAPSINVPASQFVSTTTNMPQSAVTSINNNLINAITNNQQAITNISQQTGLTNNQVKSVFSSFSQNLSQPVSKIISNVATQSNVSKQKVTQVLKTLNTHIEPAIITNNTSQSEGLPAEKISQVVQGIPQAIAGTASKNQNIPLAETIAKTADLPANKVQNIISTHIGNSVSNEEIVNSISQNTGISSSQTKQVLNAFAGNSGQPTNTIIKQISAVTAVPREKVAQTLHAFGQTVISNQDIVSKTSATENVASEKINTVMDAVVKQTESVEKTTESQPIEKLIALSSNMPEEKARSVIRTFVKYTVARENFINELSQPANITPTQTKDILTTFAENSQMPADTVIAAISAKTGLDKEKVVVTLKSMEEKLQTSRNIVKQISEKEKVGEEQISKIITDQIPLVTEPDKHIEKIVNIPPTVSIEDYEEVKKMWKEQYEKGEVPVTENITSRREWIDNDIVFITNTLNKLLSEDQKLKVEGLDDLGYILPFFMINNLKGEELLVYLKAKVEAAKAIAEKMDIEKEVTEKLKHKDDQELVEKARPKEEAKAKHMEMEEELPEEKEEESGDNKPANELQAVDAKSSSPEDQPKIEDENKK